MRNESPRLSRSANFIWFLAGLGLGTAAGIIVAPNSGAATRRMIRTRASHAGEMLAENSREYFDLGRELYERGRQLAEEAAEMFEAGRRLMDEADAVRSDCDESASLPQRTVR